MQKIVILVWTWQRQQAQYTMEERGRNIDILAILRRGSVVECMFQFGCKKMYCAIAIQT